MMGTLQGNAHETVAAAADNAAAKTSDDRKGKKFSRLLNDGGSKAVFLQTGPAQNRSRLLFGHASAGVPTATSVVGLDFCLLEGLARQGVR
jgi:hypothetical protein